MAADTREDTSPPSSTPSQTKPPSSQGKETEAYAVPTLPQNANALPAASGLNTAGGKPKEASLFDALRSIRMSEFKEVHKKPCVRDALLTGIGGGFGIGGVRAILGAPVWKTCNWAVGSFVFGSFLMYEFCQRKRLLERQGLKRAVEVIDRKKTEKQMKAEEARAARRKAKEEA
ncbi:hypothetical protein MMC28_005033 [Mycoblastus sanguinarius]|nr:hypothetical protein [Mycoblastus sanguinarius]